MHMIKIVRECFYYQNIHGRRDMELILKVFSTYIGIQDGG